MKTLFTSKNRALVVLGVLICGLLAANLIATSSLEAQLGTVRVVDALKVIARDSARVNGTLTVNGAATFAAATIGLRDDFEILATGDKTVTNAMSGRIFMATAASGTQTFTLPNAGTTVGLKYVFICGDAGGEILVTPATGDKIRIKATEDAGASVAPAAGTGVKNTAGTNVLGDHLHLVFDGVDTWHMVGQSGIWASQ